MKLIKPNVPAGGQSSGGYVGSPQPRDWLKEWIASKGYWVKLECGHIEDISDRGLLILKTFDGTTVGCERCNAFSPVVRTMKRRTPPVKTPDTPMF